MEIMNPIIFVVYGDYFRVPVSPPPLTLCVCVSMQIAYYTLDHFNSETVSE